MEDNTMTRRHAMGKNGDRGKTGTDHVLAFDCFFKEVELTTLLDYGGYSPDY